MQFHVLGAIIIAMLALIAFFSAAFSAMIYFEEESTVGIVASAAATMLLFCAGIFCAVLSWQIFKEGGR